MERQSGVTVAVPVLPDGMVGRRAVLAQRDLLDGLLADANRPVSVLWYYTPMALAFSDHVEADLVIYDNMDELSAFRGASPALLANEDGLFGRADLVFTGGMSLYEAKRGRHPAVFAFPSSIDVAHFAAARAGRASEPADQAGIPGPRLGFFGVIDERMDLGLVAAVADLRPDWHLVMVGPVVKIDPEALPRRANIHWLGQKPYADLPAYMAGWDLGFMPFALNESTRFISPTKTPEFLAAGLPVVSTRIADVVRPYGVAGLVEIAESAADVVRLATGLLERPPGPWLAAVDRHLAAGSWDATWEGMRDAMSGSISARRSARSASAKVESGAVAHV